MGYSRKITKEVAGGAQDRVITTEYEAACGSRHEEAVTGDLQEGGIIDDLPASVPQPTYHNRHTATSDRRSVSRESFC
ncbi:hypothetical protein ACP4OV_027673 [Aristida adscensionis]